MDHIDREILQILQHNARASLKMIAEKTFLSSPAVSARIEKLEKDGIITSYQAQIDPMKLGYHILAFINLNVLPEDKQKFYNYAEGIPNILECSSVTGEYSVIMKVAFESTMQLDSFLKLLVLPMITFFVLRFFIKDRTLLEISTILSGCPIAGNVSMLCMEYNQDVTLVSKGICISTLLSMISIPIVSALVAIL